ncbi:hypothetical protein EV421DRAFT_1743107 [Armillaria borealis]|uniref:Uncharacterized protein n=1 Tax=Armillaria borealis TaxID=47425 RepID=A0AA39IVX1_9AGAR|nr:hypothetical protein EV421DRAFT_1743107 [Armillaria borealis]
MSLPQLSFFCRHGAESLMQMKDDRTRPSPTYATLDSENNKMTYLKVERKLPGEQVPERADRNISEGIVADPYYWSETIKYLRSLPPVLGFISCGDVERRKMYNRLR